MVDKLTAHLSLDHRVKGQPRCSTREAAPSVSGYVASTRVNEGQPPEGNAVLHGPHLYLRAQTLLGSQRIRSQVLKIVAHKDLLLDGQVKLMPVRIPHGAVPSNTSASQRTASIARRAEPTHRPKLTTPITRSPEQDSGKPRAMIIISALGTRKCFAGNRARKENTPSPNPRLTFRWNYSQNPLPE